MEATALLVEGCSASSDSFFLTLLLYTGIFFPASWSPAAFSGTGSMTN